jgi:nitrous oxidase accessory protein
VIGTATSEDQSGNGIHLWDCDSIQISKNEVTGMRDGIYLEFVDSSVVSDNHSHHNVRYGLHFMFSNHDVYSSNTFERNGAGVAVMFSKWITMNNNTFLQNWGSASYGLLLKEIYDGEVFENKFDQNTIAIYVDGSSRVTYKNNIFKQNGWAIKVSGGCYTNKFTSNDFISNSFGISYNSMLNDNTFNGNYWSDYSGYDLDRDGVGDVPYRPVKLFSYIINKTPEAIVLMRSLFVDIINFSEKVSPVFTPDGLIDQSPSMNPFR